MSAFSIDFEAAAVGAHLAVYGQAVTYEAPDTAAVALTAVVGAITATEIADDTGRLITQSREVRIRRDPAAAEGGVARIREDGVMVIDGERWPIVDPPITTESQIVVRVSRTVQREWTRPGYRAGR